jgi:hypothetical protein
MAHSGTQTSSIYISDNFTFIQYLSSASHGQHSVLETTVAHMLMSKLLVQLFWFGTGVAILVWFSGALLKQPKEDEDHKAGIMACALVYLAYSTLQGPSSVMIRPHPIVWKFVHGCSMLYLLGIVFLLMQGKAAARHMLKVCNSTSFSITLLLCLFLLFLLAGQYVQIFLAPACEIGVGEAACHSVLKSASDPNSK